LHRAAAYGNPGDITLLERLNANPMLQTIKLSWMPIFCAVQFGNISTFKELKKHHSNFLTLRDIRHWTLLHLAVNAKRLELMALLIELGADPHARSLAVNYLVPDDLKGLSVTPGDIAYLRGAEVLSVFVDTLRRNGHELEVVRDPIENVAEVFWPTTGKEAT
jgi:ankyrin repeat protein